jgi:hypothetical protein
MSNWKENQALAGYEFTQNIIFALIRPDNCFIANEITTLLNVSKLN